MKLKLVALLLFLVAVALPICTSVSVEGQSGTEALTTDMDAKTDDLFNNFGVRGTPVDECVADPEPPTVRGNGTFEANKFIFEEEETVEDGLGPTYNDVGCVTCHQAVDTGAFGQQMEFRAGHVASGNFVDNPGGQLIHARGTDSDIVEHILSGENVRSFRLVITLLAMVSWNVSPIPCSKTTSRPSR